MNYIRIIFREFAYAYNTRKIWSYTATSRTKARFSRTILGSFWLGLSNLLSILALGMVYGTVFRVDDFKSYFLYLGFGLVIWNTISSSIISAPQLFSQNSANIRNMNIRPIFYTFEEWGFQLQTFLQSFGLVFIVLSIIKPSIIFNPIFSIWLPILNLIIFIYWFPLIICLLGTWYRDFSQLVPVVLHIVFLISPILYQKDSLGSLDWIVKINFIFQILEPLRDSILVGNIDYKIVISMLIFNIAGCLSSVLLLNRYQKSLPFLV